MRDESNRIVLRFVILLGVVSLFSDMIYKADRSITGPCLAILGPARLLLISTLVSVNLLVMD